MPNPELGCDGLSSIFIDHIYSNTGTRAWEFTAAISGAHTLGSATIANSGYDGFWGSSEQAGKFNNDYFRSILVKGWYQELAVNGNANKNQFKRIDGGSDRAHKEMMLSTDMCLAFDAN
jgi:catalase (peroxidase I)